MHKDIYYKTFIPHILRKSRYFYMAMGHILVMNKSGNFFETRLLQNNRDSLQHTGLPFLPWILHNSVFLVFLVPPLKIKYTMCRLNTFKNISKRAQMKRFHVFCSVQMKIFHSTVEKG